MNRKRVFSLVVALCFQTACGGGSSESSNLPPVAVPPPAPSPQPAYDGSGLTLDVDTEDDTNISALVGEVSQYEIFLARAIPTIRTSITLVGRVAGIEILETEDRFFIVVDGTVIPGGSVIPLTVVAINLDNQLQVTRNVLVNVLEPTLVASGRITSVGGAISSDDGAVGVQIDPGALSAPIEIEIHRAVTPTGRLIVRAQFDRDVAAEAGAITLTSNLAAFATAASAAIATSPQSGFLSSGAHSETRANYPLIYDITNFPGYFVDKFRAAASTNSFRTLSRSCNQPSSTPVLSFCWTLDPRAVALKSSKPESCFLLEPEDTIPNDCELADMTRVYAPVLLVHGHKLGSSLGGGSETWGDFPALINGITGPSNRTLITFEFRWRTNASFRVVADELAAAIVRLHDLTGEPVRIVAHSFGGLLIRTLLQGQAQGNVLFDPAYVHSVMTIGTPHSGIFPAMNAQFPNGQDLMLRDLCDQITCWQAGESGKMANVPPDIKEIAQFGSLGGLITDLALPSGPNGRNVPEDMPFVVAIGLKRERVSNVADENNEYDSGDGIISFDGQRFLPQPDSSSSALLDCLNPNDPGSVTEVVLGPLDSGGRSVGDPRPGQRVQPPTSGGNQLARGYAHADRWPIIDRQIEYAEPHVHECTDSACEEHAALTVFRNLAGPLSENFYCVSDRSIGIPPEPTMLGYEGTYVTEYPQQGIAISDRYTAVIGPVIEIRGGEIRGLDGHQIIRSSTDFGSDTIVATYIDAGRATSATFNGPVYYFEETSPRIIDAQLDSLSSFSTSEARVTFADHAVWVNMSGVFIDVGDRIVIRLTLE